uniref:8-amino-7-oxononanoate synthase n=1 Tax=Candidatus Kentrum sp. DK TaxID=2126562 RepID=A0A450SDH0_9GAMM|nr:MAG: 8-amino-7-oxononanoate synthase [Candidatus Kentron sp. DK]VFJ54570.1 MAG: 8-amino-7-oxononanoate synthase [Candidatus Kentron sp. DK]
MNNTNSLEETIRSFLEENERAGLRRVRSVLASPQGVRIEIDGRPYLSFSSNDYLGLASDPRMAEAFKRGADRYGVGSGAASVVSGHYLAHHALEEELADFTGRERALLFSTGYMANLGIISALVGRNDQVYEDRLNHASLLDAAVLSRARLRRYAHGDPVALEESLATGGNGKRKLIATDGVFSMDGDVAPLPALMAAGKRHDAWLMVDDAHGLGVLGEHGGGALAHFGLGSGEVPVLMGTLGKALGTFGAFAAGDKDVVEYLMQRARPFLFTTALPPAVAEAARTGLAIAREESWRRKHLQDLVARFRAGAERIGLVLSTRDPAIAHRNAASADSCVDSIWHAASTEVEAATPIQPVLVGEAKRAIAISRALRESGLFVQAIRPPTVPKGTARLRITFSASHEKEQVDRLLDALSEVFSQETKGR